MSRYIIGIVGAGLVLLATTATASAQTCSGKWGGREDTSITIRSGTKLTYCYMGNCGDVNYSGNPQQRISFNLRSGAVVTASARAGGYAAQWKGPDNRRANANLRCR
jgi:hypothetical protein